MGCVNSRADINDLHPNIFQVMNVDDLGNLITPGRLEITESDIVLYQRGKQPVQWPLRCLRRYGYDSEIFSFESGRRCSTGPGIYAFKCHRADQLFNLVQSNIQVCNGSGDDTVSRDLSVTAHTVPTITRVTISPIEANCLDSLPARSNSRAASRFPHSQQNGIGRLGSVGSSSGPMSPQGTMGSPSPPPNLMTGAPMGPPPPPPQQPPQPISASVSSIRHHPSAVYVNEQILSTFAIEMELDNNNKSLRGTIQRSKTVSSTSSSGLLSDPSSGMVLLNQDMMKLATPAATYMNIDISSEPSPLSPTRSASNTGQLPRDEVKETDRERHAYINVSTGQETTNVETLGRIRPIALPQHLPLQLHQQQQQQQQLTLNGEWDESSSHCYANLKTAEIEGLRVRFSSGGSVASGMEKSPPPPPPLLLPFPSLSQNQTSLTPPPCEPIREVNYAVLDLDKNNTSSLSSSTPLEPLLANAIPSPPDSPNKPQKGYATIDFNKTAALSHSVNPNVVNDNEGSRKTRHNSTINELMAPSRHSSSISE